MVMVSLHSNRNPNTEVDTRDWGIAGLSQTMFLFGVIWTLVLWVRKTVEGFKRCLMGHTSRSMKDNSAEYDLNCGGGGWLKRSQRRRILICGLEIILVIF